MRAVIQRVSEASVTIENKKVAQIGKGFLVFLGIEEADSNEDGVWLSNKIAKMRIFSDENGLMNKSVQDINGNIIVVSQFTLFASTKKGNRPGFTKSAKPSVAIPLYEKFVELLFKETACEVQTGEFGADMKVSLINDGPVTICIDTKNKE